MSHKSKTITLGKLRMMDAQLEYRIQAGLKEVSSLDGAVDKLLSVAAKSDDETCHSATAHEISSKISRKRELLKDIETAELKRRAVQHLIALQERESSAKLYGGDVLDGLSNEELERLAEEKDVRQEIDLKRAKEVLEKFESSEDYEKILAGIRSAAFDGESVSCVRAELDDLARKQTL